MKMTMNGLQNSEFDEIKKRLTKDAEQILNAVNSDSGHLGNIISALKITCSSIDLKSEKLIKIFNEQKSK